MKNRGLIIGLVIVAILGLLAFGLMSADYQVKLSNIFHKAAIEKYKNQATLQSRLKLGKLYFESGEYELSYNTLRGLKHQQAQKISALCLFKLNRFTEALSIFNKLEELPDSEYLYYYGLTCEKHNLYDKAEKIYLKIQDGQFKQKAEERIKSISLFVHQEVSSDMLGILENSPAQTDYPEAGALILSIEEELEILPDNTSISTIHTIIKILNDRGKEDFSEVLLGYDSTYEKVELEFARTIRPDGTAVLVGDKNIRDVSRYLNFPLYSNARVKIISMPEVSSGCLIEYKAHIFSSRLVADRHFSVNYFLQESEPVLYSSFKLTTPIDRDVNTKILNSEYNKLGIDLLPKIKKEEPNKRIYFLEVKNIPQIIPEPDMPPKAEIDTILLMSSFNSWDQIFNWWRGLYKDKIIPDENIRRKVEELTRGLKSETDKARAIYNFCAQEIRYVAVEYGQAGYEPHKASDVFLNKYGDCKDQAMLLIAMLKLAGFDAYPVLIGTKGSIALSENFPSLLFNHAITILNIDSKFIFLDPTAETVSFGDLPFSDQARKTLVFFEDKYRIMPTPDFGSEYNFLRFDTHIQINPDESITAERSLSSSGIYEQGRRYWLIYSPPSIIEEGIKSKVQEFTPNGKLIDYIIENARNLNKPIVFNYRFEGDDFLVKAGKARVLLGVSGGVDISTVLKEERTYPLDFGVLSERTDTVRIDIPKNFRFKYIPDSFKIDNQWMDFSLDYALDGNRLKYKNRKALKKKYISSAEYPQYKAFIENLARRLNQAIILESRE